MAFDLNTIITQQVAYFPYFTAISGPLTDIQEGDEIDTRGGGKVEVPLCGTSTCLLYTSPSPRDQRGSRMPSSA